MSRLARQVRPKSERRAAPRSELRVEVTMADDLNFYYGLTHDLAAGGLFVSTYETFPIGAELTLHLSLSEEDAPLTLRGRVHWVREHSPLNQDHAEVVDLPPGVGLQLIDPDPAALDRLRLFLADREPTLYE